MMQSPSHSAPKVATPPKGSGRVEDGRIRKLKVPSKSDTTAIQHFNGRTYACESCKRGHRVHKCDHGKTRPISETNQPGRPSAGKKRGCHCPRNCACTTKSCRCDRDCACTQEMYLIVRIDNPAAVSREATSTPKPVWEDSEGNKMTLKKVWADANGKEIDVEEYHDRQRRMKEREEAAKDTPKSSCCGSKKPKDEPVSPKGGCRHRQSTPAIQPHPGTLEPNHAPNQLLPTPATEPWMSTCTCGSGCSCLYCPDHPNNATSINHTQQQVKNIAEQAYIGRQSLTPVPSMTEDTSRSCLGSQPSFFLSRTPEVSQQQFEQFFPDTLNPNTIYLTYPIQHHSWTNRPLSSHCSGVHSPSGMMPISPGSNDHPVDSGGDATAALSHLPNDASGTWNFADGYLGDNSFSWTDFDASCGTDYSIGQATVASFSNAHNLPMFPPSITHQTSSLDPNMSSLTSASVLDGSLDSLPVLDPQNAFVNFDIPVSSSLSNESIQLTQFGSESLPGFIDIPLPSLDVSEPPHPHPEDGPPATTAEIRQATDSSTAWEDFGVLHEAPRDSEFNARRLVMSNSPVMNCV